MKKVLLLILFVACKNRKEEIIGKQEAVREQIIFMTLKANQFNHRAESLIRNKNHPLTKEELDLFNTCTDSARQFEHRVEMLRKTFDSLEVELKKY